MVGRSIIQTFRKTLCVAFGAGLLFGPSLSWGSGGDRIPGSRYVSGRAAALGDAYINLADTIADGLFYNPAAIAKVDHLTVEPLNLQVQSNNKLSSLFGKDFYKFQSLPGYQSTLLQNPNTNPGGGFAVLPTIGFQGFGVGMMYQERLMAETNGVNIRYRTVYQLIPTAGFGLRLASGVLRLGYSLQWVNQASGDKTVTVASNPNWKDGIAEGKGFSHNFGMTLTLPYIYQPTISVVARNIAGLKLSGTPMIATATNPTGTIPDEKMSLDSAIGFLSKFGGGSQLSLQFAYRDGTNSSATRTIAHFATGAELVLLDRFNFRGGYGSGYPSAGFGIKTEHGEANLAWYSEDLGDGVTPVRDIRYLAQFIFRAF